MTTQTEALKLALEALIGARAFLESDTPVEIWSLNDKAITAIKEALAQQSNEQVEPIPMIVKTAPERIWLDIGFDPSDEDEISFNELVDATWSQDNATGYGIEYVRADIYPPVPTAQPKEPEQSDVVSGKTFDRIVALNESNAARVLELEEKLEALAQPEQEPVAIPEWVVPRLKEVAEMLQSLVSDAPDAYATLNIANARLQVASVFRTLERSTTPPQRKPLTNEEIERLRIEQEFDQWAISEGAFKYAARAIEAAHGIKE